MKSFTQQLSRKLAQLVVIFRFRLRSSGHAVGGSGAMTNGLFSGWCAESNGVEKAWFDLAWLSLTYLLM